MGGSYSTLPEIQSFDVKGAKKVDGEGVPRVHAPDAVVPTTPKYGPKVDSLYKQFVLSVGKFATNPCMGKRALLEDGKAGPFEWMSYAECLDKINKIGSGMASLGIGKGDSFGLYAANSIEWACCGLGGFSVGATLVPVYDTLGDNIVQYEVNHATVKIMFVEAKKLGSVLSVLKECPSLTTIVQFEPLGAKPELPEGVTLMDLATLEAAGAAQPKEPTPAAGEDVALIMYTSGTTGDPKGVCLTQSAITIAASYCGGLELFPTDAYLSYLPLAHIFETVVEHGMWSAGARVGYFGGNIKLLLEDVAALQPTVFVGVPRVYQRVYDKALAGINAKSPTVSSVLLWALEKEMAAVREGSHTIWNTLFKKIFRKVMGGNVRIMLSGAAPLPSHVQDFLLATMGCSVIQGYGMTENCANCTLQHPAEFHAGNVGPPMPTCEVKLKDVPEMNYTSSSSPPCGEVLMRGGTVFSHYHKNPTATAETIDSDGWLQTGDIGRWNPDGTLSIIDRKKNIFKLAQGEYVAAEKIEMALGKSAFIGQIWVYGNSYFPMLVAVVVPDFEALMPHAKAQGWKADDKAALAASPEVKKLMLDEVAKFSKEAKLKSFEVPKDLVCEGTVNELAQGFSIENDCLTPTFKLKRPQLLKKYQAQVNELYTALGEDVTKQK